MIQWIKRLLGIDMVQGNKVVVTEDCSFFSSAYCETRDCVPSDRLDDDGKRWKENGLMTLHVSEPIANGVVFSVAGVNFSSPFGIDTGDEMLFRVVKSRPGRIIVHPSASASGRYKNVTRRINRIVTGKH